jgi:regulator of replication initiation timing
MTILTQREVFLLVIGSITYIVLFIVTVQNSRRKILLLRQRLDKVHAIQEENETKSLQRIEQNKVKIAELEELLRKLGDENSMLRLELEEKKAKLDYANKMAIIENEKRQQAETAIFSSDIYLKLKRLMAEGRSLSEVDWQQLMETVDGVYTGFTEKLYSLYKMSEQDYHVCLLIKVRVSPKDIAILTAHSKESVATTRSRLYQKIFGQKGSSKDWDEFILSL